MNKKRLRRVLGLLTICFAAVLASVNHNVSYENRIPSLIIVGLFGIGGWTLSSRRKRRVEDQERQTMGQRILQNEQRAKWATLACLLIVLAGALVTRFLVIPSASRAAKIGFLPLQRWRDLSTPSSRLEGHWVGVPDGGELYYWPIDHSLACGTFTWRTNSDVAGKLKLISESRSGTYLKTREFLIIAGQPGSFVAEYCVPKHGQSMTKEIILQDGSRYLIEYRYVDGRVCPSMPEGFVLDR